MRIFIKDFEIYPVHTASNSKKKARDGAYRARGDLGVAKGGEEALVSSFDPEETGINCGGTGTDPKSG